MSKHLTKMFKQARQLLVHAMKQECDVEPRVGMELEHRIHGEKLSKKEIRNFEEYMRDKGIGNAWPFQRFHYADQYQRYEIITGPYGHGISAHAMQTYKEKAGDWLSSKLEKTKKIDFSPVYYNKSDKRRSNALHVNVELLKDNIRILRSNLDEHFINPICAMMQETLRENMLCLIENPEEFVAQRKQKKYFKNAWGKEYDCTLCVRKTNIEHNCRYLEIRVADSKANPHAAEAVALLGLYLGLKHPEAKQTKTDLEMPQDIQTSAYWFLRGSLLRDTLDILSTRYGEELGIPPHLGTLIHHTILDQHTKDMPNHAQKLKINTDPITSYQRSGRSLV